MIMERNVSFTTSQEAQVRTIGYRFNKANKKRAFNTEPIIVGMRTMRVPSPRWCASMSPMLPEQTET